MNQDMIPMVGPPRTWLIDESMIDDTEPWEEDDDYDEDEEE